MNSLLSRGFVATTSCIRNWSPQLIVRTYREIRVTEEDKVTTIEGHMGEDDNSRYVPSDDPTDSCPLRSRGIQVTYEDVLILRQFITSEGEMLPRSATGLCSREHYKVSSAVKMAQRARLLPGSDIHLDTAQSRAAKFHCYLTNNPIGSQNPVKKRGPFWKKRFYKIGNAVISRDAPRVSRKRMSNNH